MQKKRGAASPCILSGPAASFPLLKKPEKETARRRNACGLFARKETISQKKSLPFLQAAQREALLPAWDRKRDSEPERKHLPEKE